ncbi:MAG: WXG100 family type VII secretion target [Mycobacteriaceae bacterium]
MPHSMAVDPAALLAAADAIEKQAAQMLAIHTAWDAAVHAALPGWIGRSRHALEELTAGWAADRVELAGKLTDLATSLRMGAASFTEMDGFHAGTLGG